jgi:hypothetical protein
MSMMDFAETKKEIGIALSAAGTSMPAADGKGE